VVENGYVVLSGRNIETSRPFVEAMIARVQELVAALSIEEARVLPRLEKIAAEEASPEVRAHALTVLARAFPKARTRHIFEKAREDVSPLVRVRALEGLKDPELADIAAVLRDPGTSYELMIDAIRVALRHHPRPHVEACLIELFDGARGQEGPLRIALIESLGRLKSERCASSFLALLAERDPGTRESAARALGWLGATRFEADLFPLLEDDDEEVADAAVFALGACGTIAAIAPLRAADDHLEVEDAIRRIIGRHGAPRAGGLAIVGDANNQSGALSLSAGGELSEVPEPRDP
jgi:HEAT repeat protein